MRLALVVVLVLLAATGWQHREALPLSLFHHGVHVAYGRVGTAGAAAGWLETSSGQGVRRARCTAASARPPAPPIPSFVASGRLTIGSYNCRGAAAHRQVHAWCVIGFQYQSPSSPPVIVWDAAYTRCGTLARADARRFG